MKSLRYRLLEKIVPFACHRNIYQMGPEELLRWLERERSRRDPAPPAWIRRNYPVRTETVNGRPLHIVSPARPGGGEPGGAVLFLHGGGFIFEAHGIHWRAVSKIVDALGIPVWLPAYPLASGKASGDPVNYPSIRDINEMICSVYLSMAERYGDSNTALLGDSAGAALALIFCHHRRALGLPLPRRLVLVSPAMIVERDRAVLESMRAIERAGTDIMLSTVLMDSLAELLDVNSPVESYYHTPLLGNFGGFPEMDVFSGDAEIFYPQVPGFVERARRAGVAVNFHAGAGMMHVWPYMPLAPESKAALENIIAAIGGALLPDREDTASKGTAGNG